MMLSRQRSIALLALSSGMAISSNAMAQFQIDPVDPVLRASLRRVYPNPAGPGNPTDAPAPDVIVGEIQDQGFCCPDSEDVSISPSGTVGSIVAYGLGTSSCNIGTVNVQWISGTPYHPIIPQNMYRLETVNGSTRLEQLGQSWSKYAFTALTYNVCGSCNGSGGAVLGVGCSDPYTASRNATQSSAGPRYQCNPFTGSFPDSTAVRNAWPAAPATIGRRLQVNTNDISSSLHPGALYFGECMYVTRDDACFGMSKNNASYRRFVIGAGNNITMQGAIGGGGTQRTKPAINAWKDNGLGIGVSDPNVMISEVTCGNTFQAQPAYPYSNGTALVSPLGDGWYYVASKATSLGGGVWHYEYAVENLNSDRGIGSFSVNFPAGAIITNAEMKQMLCHSGVTAEDAQRNAAWTQTIGAASITWATPNPTASGELGSYIRWATMCNFRFDANVAPVTGTVASGYFKSLAGYPNSMNVAAYVPDPAVGTPCYSNCDNSTTAPILTANDFQCFLNAYAQGQSYANCDNSTTPPVLTANDFQCFLNSYAAGCS